MQFSRRAFAHLLGGALAGVALFGSRVAQAFVYKPCDVYQGFTFRKDKNSRVGFITAFTEASIPNLKADIPVKNPMSPDTNLQVFAVLHEAGWSGNVDDPMQFAGQISSENKKAIALALNQSMASLDVQFQFVVFEYDPNTKAYFRAMHSDEKTLHAKIEAHGGDLNIAVGDRPFTGVPSPENYPFSVALVPARQNVVQLAVSESAKFNKWWGRG